MSKAKKSDQAKRPSAARKAAKRRFLPITPIEAGDPMVALANSSPAGYPPKQANS